MEVKVKENLLKLFSVIFILTSAYILYTAIFNTPGLFISLKSSIVLIGTLILLVSMYLLDKKLNKLDNRSLKIIVNVAFVIMILLQIGFVVVFLVNPSWDYYAIMNSAREIARGNTMLTTYYYVQYPNNIGATLLLAQLFKLVSIFTQKDFIYLMVAILFNIFMINITIFALYTFVKKAFGQSRATLLSIFLLIMTPFYAYSQIVYTDTMTMIFPIMMFYMLYSFINSKNKNRYLYLIGIGIFGVMGTILKTNIVISIIAMLIYLIFTNKIVEGIKCCVILMIPFIIIMGIYQSIASNYIPVPYDEAGLPFTHWVMMGLKGPNGSYNYDDVEFSTNLKLEQGKEAVKKANIQEIKNRLKEYGVKDYLTFVNRKVSITWGDGTYYAPNKIAREPVKDNNLKQYVIGDKNSGFMYLSQFSHVAILIGIFVGAIALFKKPTGFAQGIHICIFGVFLFLILWETRSRYLVCYLPVLIYAGFNGLDHVFKMIDKKIIR